MKLKVKITGIKEIDRALGELEPKLIKKVLRSTLRSGAKDLVPDFKQEIPEDTGLLKETLKVKAGKRRKNKISYQVVGGSKEKGAKTAWYSFIVNYGSKYRVGDHYIERVVEKNEERIQQKMRTDIFEFIKKYKL